MSIQLYKKHHYHYFLENLFFFENVILEPHCVDGGSSIVGFRSVYMDGLRHEARNSNGKPTIAAEIAPTSYYMIPKPSLHRRPARQPRG